MEMPSPFGDDKHEFCLVVIELGMFAVAHTLISLIHDFIQ